MTYGQVRSIDTVVGPTIEELLEETVDGEQHVTSYDLNKRYGVKVAPKRVVFDKLRPGHKMQKSVYIYKPDDPAFTVRVKSAPETPAIARLFKYEENDALLYELRILFSADPQGGQYNSEIKLTSNDTREPEIIIPVGISADAPQSSQVPLVAAGLKEYELFAKPLTSHNVWTSVAFQVECELMQGLWLPTGLFALIAVFAESPCIDFRSLVTLYAAANAPLSCGCFGTGHGNLWIVLMLTDLPTAVRHA